MPFLFVATLSAACGSTTADNSAGGGGSSGLGGSQGSTGGDDSSTGGGPAGGGGHAGGGGSTGSNALPVNLGHAGHYAILAKSAISTVPASAVVGDLGVSPAAASFITGFSLTADATQAFATSMQVTGKVYAADYAAPTPADLTAAIGDMQLAFTDAAGRAPDVTELGAGDIGGMTLTRGVYKWGTGLGIPVDITLTGGAKDVWIFQIAKDLLVGNAARITLTGGALAKNVFWQVAGLVDVGTTAHLEGVVLTKTAITVHTGASVDGRLFAQTAVSIDSDSIVQPAP